MAPLLPEYAAHSLFTYHVSTQRMPEPETCSNIRLIVLPEVQPAMEMTSATMTEMSGVGTSSWIALGTGTAHSTVAVVRERELMCEGSKVRAPELFNAKAVREAVVVVQLQPL